MRKHFLIVSFLSFFCLAAFSQFDIEKREALKSRADSLKKVSKKLKGKAKVDCLNSIVDIYQILDEDYQTQIDSAGPYAIQSFNEAKSIGYKRGLGYAYLKLSYFRLLKAEINEANHLKLEPVFVNQIKEHVDQAMRIASELNDNIMAGSAYTWIGWLEELKGNNEQLINNLKKSISLIENNFAKQPKGQYKEMNYTDCIGCTGGEFRLAFLYYWISDSTTNETEKIESLMKALEYYKKAEARPAVANMYTRLVLHLFTEGDIEKGKEILKGADHYFQANKNESAEFRFYSSLSPFFWSFGDFENGLEVSRKSVKLAENLEKKSRDANSKKWVWGQAYFWMGRFYRIAGDYETALKFTRKAYDYYPSDEKGNDMWAAEMGITHGKMGNYDSAMFYLGPFENNRMAFIGAKAYLGDLFISMGQFDRALPLINECIDVGTKGNGIQSLPLHYTNAAKLFFGKKDYPAALSNARKSISILNKIKRNTILIETYFILSDIFNKLGKYDSAYIYLSKYTVLKDSLFNKQLYIRLNDIKKEAEEERRISQLNLLNKDNQLKEQKLNQEATVRTGLIVGLILLLLLGVLIFRTLTLKRKGELQKQRLENEKKQTELEMQALRAQMNPHFIFNCLSSINRFILKNESKVASNYLTRFSRLIRMVLINSQKPMITLNEELEMLRIYLDMERLRFKNSFDYFIGFKNEIDTEAVFLPPLILQPICENALWHGLMHKQGHGHLNIDLSLENNILQCVIADDGIGRERAAELKNKTEVRTHPPGGEEKSMGLHITGQRLALINQNDNVQTCYAIEDVMDENKNVAGTRVTLRIHYQEKEEFA